jgi:signal transduction histidine kinase
VSELVKYKNSLLDRNEEMQITLYRIGHDIKGPANSIKQLVLFSKTDKENSEVYLEKIDVSIQQLIFFIQEVETLIRAKESDLKIEETDIAKIVQRCWSELGFYMEGKNHKLAIDVKCTHTIYTDATLLYSILLNIISNAIKYHDLANKKENLISLSVNCSNNILYIEITDNGMGMDEATVEGIYKLFYRGNSIVSGTGLGMNIAKKAIERLNGSVKISSKPGKGTSFYLSLPVQDKNNLGS